eukprot:m.399992 g.399992  ORF g.399992 m.399992 type:complete len:87 (+) comp56439_c0_seq1:2869-3129(+)
MTMHDQFGNGGSGEMSLVAYKRKHDSLTQMGTSAWSKKVGSVGDPFPPISSKLQEGELMGFLSAKPVEKPAIFQRQPDSFPPGPSR